MAQVQLGIITGSPDEGIVHEFHTGGVQSFPEQYRNDACGFGLVGEDSQYIGFIGSLGQQLQGHFRDDAQGTFAADHQLIQAVAGGILFAPGAQTSDLAIGQHHFDGVDLVPGGAVTDGFVTAGVGGQGALQGSPA